MIRNFKSGAVTGTKLKRRKITSGKTRTRDELLRDISLSLEDLHRKMRERGIKEKYTGKIGNSDEVGFQCCLDGFTLAEEGVNRVITTQVGNEKQFFTLNFQINDDGTSADIEICCSKAPKLLRPYKGVRVLVTESSQNWMDVNCKVFYNITVIFY